MIIHTSIVFIRQRGCHSQFCSFNIIINFPTLFVGLQVKEMLVIKLPLTLWRPIVRFRTIFTSGCILHVSLLKLALVTPRLRKNRGGRGRGAGGRGRGRGGAHANYDAAFGYNDEDDNGLNGFPQFTPDTEPGLNLPENFHPTCERKLKTRNFDTSFGQHSLTFFYYFAHFCFAMQPSFQKMYGLLFAILLPLWVIVQ